MAGFAWDQPAVWGVEHSTRSAVCHPSPTCFIRPKAPPQHSDDKIWDCTLEERYPNPQEHEVNVSVVCRRAVQPGSTVAFLSVNSAGARRRHTESIHILLPPHELLRKSGQRRYTPNSITLNPQLRQPAPTCHEHQLGNYTQYTGDCSWRHS